MASRETSPPRSLIWAVPQGNYWDWIRSHLGLQSVVEIESQQLLTQSAARDEMLSSASCWVLGVDGRYDSDLCSPLADLLLAPAPALERPKAKGGAKTSRSTRKSSASTDDKTAALIPSALAIAGAVLLGEPWSGHRRTFPLPDPIVPFYWYELYDRFLPWVSTRTSTLSHSDADPKSGSPLHHAARGLTPRVSNWIDVSQQSGPIPSLTIGRCDGRATTPIALVIAESFATSQLWEDLLGIWGVPALIAKPGQLRMQVKPDLVFVDLDPLPRQVEYGNGSLPPQPTVDLFDQLRLRFPDAFLAGFDSFPRWSCWAKLESLGVDALFPKPFSTFGLQWCIRRWIDLSPPGTIDIDRRPGGM